MLNNRYKEKTVPPRCISGTITVFAGSYIRLRDYQASPSLTCPELSRRNPSTAHPLDKMKAVKGKKMAESYSTTWPLMGDPREVFFPFSQQHPGLHTKHLIFDENGNSGGQKYWFKESWVPDSRDTCLSERRFRTPNNILRGYERMLWECLSWNIR